MARRRLSKKPQSRRPAKIRVPRRKADKAVGPLEGYWVHCSGCGEEFQLRPRDNGAELVCPLCDHTSEPPGTAFIEQMSRYTLKERDLLLRSVIPVCVGLFFLLIWMSVLNNRSSIPRTGLTASITEDATELPVASTNGFSSSGTLIIGPSVQIGEVISYEGINEDETAFTGAIREETDTASPSAHAIGEAVFNKSYRTNSLLLNIFFVLATVGFLGYGIFKGFSYEKSRWSAHF